MPAARWTLQRCSGAFRLRCRPRTFRRFLRVPLVIDAEENAIASIPTSRGHDFGGMFTL